MAEKVKKVAASRREELEYEVQFFEFSPRALVDSMFNIVIDNMVASVTKMKTRLFEEFPAADHEKIGKILFKWQLALEDRAQTVFEKFEKYVISKVFHIPSYIILPEDEIQMDKKYDLTQVEESKLNKDISELEEQLNWFRNANELLKKELTFQEMIMTKFGPVIDGLERLKIGDTEKNDAVSMEKFEQFEAELLAEFSST